MDDPWANAWGDPSSKSVLDQISLSSTWPASTAISPVNDDETDIAIPSWATGPGVQWDEPTDAHASLWKRDTDHLPQSWDVQPSPYDNISLGKSTSSGSDSQSTTPPVKDLSLQTPPTLDGTFSSPQASEEESQSIETRSSTPQTFISAPSSPDAFGTFETGHDSIATDPWTPSHTVFPPSVTDEENTWKSSWTSDEQVITGGEDDVDEWDRARMEKERQDRHVPPELLSSILNQLEGLSNDLWPQTEQGDEQESFQAESLRDIYENLVLANVRDKFIPEGMMLPQMVPFLKTAVSKHAAEASRLTRHTSISRSSPFAIFMAAKGSTSWEASLKSRPETVNDDLAPPGWRVLEKTEENPQIDDPKKRATGGILSFFGRRGIVPPPDLSKSPRSTSPARPSSTPPTSNGLNHSPRPSTDSKLSLKTADNLPSPTSSLPPALYSQSGPVDSSPNPSASPTILQDSQASAPPSAVSRFLGRFSRSKSSHVNTKNSLALSTDDLEFLSDIVPSANDDFSDTPQLSALSSMIESDPLPTKLPPPLAPPPRHVPPTKSPVSNPSGIPTPEPQPKKDSIISLFDSPLAPAPIVPTAPYSQPIQTLSNDSFDFSTISTFRNQFSLPQTAEKQTPQMNCPSTPCSRTQTPVPNKRRTFNAIMSNTSNSSTIFPQAPLPNHISEFSIPGPPKVPNQHMPPSGLIKPLSPPPQILRPTQPTPPPPKANSRFDDDDFSDFLSYPADVSTQGNKSISSTFSLQNTSFMGLMANTSLSRNSGFGDFDDFVSPQLRTPSPPKLPAKPTVFAPKPQLFSSRPPRVSSPTKDKPPTQQKVSHQSDHQRTMSLMEVAASRGKWPAPPSPLPEALPPPEAPPGNTQQAKNLYSSDLDIFGISSPFQAQQASAMALMPSSTSSPAALPSSKLQRPPLPIWNNSVPANRKSQSTFSIPKPPQTLSPTSTPYGNALQRSQSPPSSTPSTAPMKSGGLSAQDLSFFEGL